MQKDFDSCAWERWARRGGGAWMEDSLLRLLHDSYLRCFFSSSAFLDCDFSSNNFMSSISPEVRAILRFKLLISRTNSSL